jgi:hypothetical protein
VILAEQARVTENRHLSELVARLSVERGFGVGRLRGANSSPIMVPQEPVVAASSKSRVLSVCLFVILKALHLLEIAQMCSPCTSCCWVVQKTINGLDEELKSIRLFV